MSAYLARLVSGRTYRRCATPPSTRKELPKFLAEKARRSEEFARGFWTGGTLFEELGSTMSVPSVVIIWSTCCQS